MHTKYPDNHTADSLLQAYESLATVHAGEKWEQQLSARIAESQGSYAGKRGAARVAAVMLLFVALNAIVFLRAGRETVTTPNDRTDLLHSVSDQLLINSTASK